MTTENGKHSESPLSLEDIIDDLMLDPETIQSISLDLIKEALEEYENDVSFEDALKVVGELISSPDKKKDDRVRSLFEKYIDAPHKQHSKDSEIHIPNKQGKGRY